MKSYWMWHWGDYEIYHTYVENTRRQEFGADYPTMWHGDVPYPTVSFTRSFTTETPGTMKVIVSGKGYFTFDGKRYPTGVAVPVAPGRHSALVRVTKLGGLPAAFIESDVCPSGALWLCDHATPEKLPAGWLPEYDAADKSPEIFPFAYETRTPVSVRGTADDALWDFGVELFGYLDISGASPDVACRVTYGESAEEAMGGADAILFEEIGGAADYRLRQRAFRFVRIEGKGASALRVTAEYEYLPMARCGSFRTDDEEVNRIWDVCRYTFHLNCRETYLDGIKRDRWVWSGDAYQCYKINRYLFADGAIDRRTILGLRGKDPVEQHINTILDYSMYWILSLEDYYMTFGDREFLCLLWPRTRTLFDFIRSRESEDGFLVGRAGDWTFVDWTEMDKTGAVCAEQMLYVATLRAMARLAVLNGERGEIYDVQADSLTERITQYYWDAEKGAFIDSYESGRRSVTRHANIFALLYGIADEAQRASIIKNVLLSDEVRRITTPYFEGFELDAMCAIGNYAYFEEMLHAYWGGMLRLGATTIWEQFDPTETGAAHYAMYNHPFGRSLCHAWGTTPIYLFGRYYLGVKPTSPGFSAFTVEPQRGGFGEIEGTVPVGEGEVCVHLTKTELTVRATAPGGTLRFGGRETPLPVGETIRIPV